VEQYDANLNALFANSRVEIRAENCGQLNAKKFFHGRGNKWRLNVLKRKTRALSSLRALFARNMRLKRHSAAAAMIRGDRQSI